MGPEPCESVSSKPYNVVQMLAMHLEAAVWFLEILRGGTEGPECQEAGLYKCLEGSQRNSGLELVWLSSRMNLVWWWP